VPVVVVSNSFDALVGPSVIGGKVHVQEEGLSSIVSQYGEIVIGALSKVEARSGNDLSDGVVIVWNIILLDGGLDDLVESIDKGALNFRTLLDLRKINTNPIISSAGAVR